MMNPLETELLQAIKANDLDFVKDCIENQFPVMQQRYGFTDPNYPKFNAVDRQGKGFIYHAIELGHFKIASYLLSKLPDSGKDLVSADGRTLAWIASARGDLESLFALVDLKDGQQKKELLTQADNAGVTPLAAAIINNNCSNQVIYFLLRHGASLDAVTKRGNNLFHLACQYKAYSNLKILLEKYFSAPGKSQLFFMENNEGLVPLEEAIEEESIECITLLLRYGAGIGFNFPQKIKQLSIDVTDAYLVGARVEGSAIPRDLFAGANFDGIYRPSASNNALEITGCRTTAKQILRLLAWQRYCHLQNDPSAVILINQISAKSQIMRLSALILEELSDEKFRKKAIKKYLLKTCSMKVNLNNARDIVVLLEQHAATYTFCNEILKSLLSPQDFYKAEKEIKVATQQRFERLIEGNQDSKLDFIAVRDQQIIFVQQIIARLDVLTGDNKYSDMSIACCCIGICCSILLEVSMTIYLGYSNLFLLMLISVSVLLAPLILSGVFLCAFSVLGSKYSKNQIKEFEGVLSFLQDHAQQHQLGELGELIKSIQSMIGGNGDAKPLLNKLHGFFRDEIARIKLEYAKDNAVLYDLKKLRFLSQTSSVDLKLGHVRNSTAISYAEALNRYSSFNSVANSTETSPHTSDVDDVDYDDKNNDSAVVVYSAIPAV